MKSLFKSFFVKTRIYEEEKIVSHILISLIHELRKANKKSARRSSKHAYKYYIKYQQRNKAKLWEHFPINKLKLKLTSLTMEWLDLFVIIDKWKHIFFVFYFLRPFKVYGNSNEASYAFIQGILDAKYLTAWDASQRGRENRKGKGGGQQAPYALLFPFYENSRTL